MIFLESLSKISVRNSELEQFSHRPHDAVGDFYLFVQIIEKSLDKLNKYIGRKWYIDYFISLGI